MSEFPPYLLKAPEDDMRRWRAAAADAGMTFADFTRTAIESWTRTVSPQHASPVAVSCPRASQHRSRVFCKTCGQIPI